MSLTPPLPIFVVVVKKPCLSALPSIVPEPQTLRAVRLASKAGEASEGEAGRAEGPGVKPQTPLPQLALWVNPKDPPAPRG
eukprot:scaffold123296_cov29-Tisochrysis_lutea.AAC.3